MKKIALAAVLPALLGSCGLFNTPTSYDVSGTIGGTAPAGTVKLAVVGVGLDGTVNADVPQVAISLSSTTKFSLDYPSVTTDGVYQVIAYIDANNDGKYNVGETRTKSSNRFLVYSKNGGLLASLAGLKAGWNYVVGTTVTQPTRITDYDLSW